MSRNAINFSLTFSLKYTALDSVYNKGFSFALYKQTKILRISLNTYKIYVRIDVCVYICMCNIYKYIFVCTYM